MRLKSLITESKKVNESAMGEIDIMVQEAETFQDFVKEFKKEFPNFDLTKDALVWLKGMYANNKRNESVIKESNYKVYHNTYTSAIQTALEYAKKAGYDFDDDETSREIGLGPKKPSEGKTNRFIISLTKGGKPQRKALQIQVYGMRNAYELNVYIS